MLTWSLCDRAPPPLSAHLATQNLFHHVLSHSSRSSRWHQGHIPGWGTHRRHPRPPAPPPGRSDPAAVVTCARPVSQRVLWKQEVPKSLLNKGNLGHANTG